MKDWQKYERYVHEKFRIYFPSCRVMHNDKIKGLISKQNRQVDISIKVTVEDMAILGIADCKHLNKKVDVEVVDYFIGFMEDVGASFGYIVTNKGYTKGALNRANIKRLRLKIVEYDNLDQLEKDGDMDELFNQRIMALECEEHIFLIRQRERRALVDLSATSLERKTVRFRDGFANTRNVIERRLLNETAVVFRDFPCIGSIKVVIPSGHQKALFIAKTEISELERLLEVNFLEIRKDIKAWRELLHHMGSRSIIQEFMKRHVQILPYEEDNTNNAT